MDNLNIWETIIENVFSTKKNLILEIQKFSKISSYEQISYTLKIRVFKSYIEKLLASNINLIKKEYEKISANGIEKIYINNRVFIFNKVVNIPEKTKEINEFKISFDAISDDNSYKGNNDFNLEELNIQNNPIVKLTFYNELLFFTKNINVDLSKFSYSKNLKKGLIGILIIIPGIIYFKKYFNEKKYVNEIKTEINSLVSLKYKPLNKKTEKIVDVYIANNDIIF